MNIILMILLVAVGFAIPVCWILRIWLEDRLVSAPQAIAGMIAHGIIHGTLLVWAPILDVVYCVLILLAIALSPLFTRLSDRKLNATLAAEDIAKYQRQLARHPENAALHSALANAYLEHRRFDEAIAEFQQAIELDPDHALEEPGKIRYARMMKAQDEERQQKNPMRKLGNMKR